MKLSIVLSLVAGALAAPAASPSVLEATVLEGRAGTCSNAAVDKLLFSTTIGSFEKSRDAKDPSACNWSSDNCSWSPDKPVGFNFIPSCHRHDFGYRNTQAQSRFTADMKKRIDDNFNNDLYKCCSQFSGLQSYKGVECRRIADIYVAFVRKYGKRNAAGDSEASRSSTSLDIELDE